MSNQPYQPLPTSDIPLSSSDPSSHDLITPSQSSRIDRFRRPTPAWWKRALLVLFILLGFVGVWRLKVWRDELKKNAGPKAKVVYADRYSKEYKYRPAASPIITERLKDGIIQIRGAPPHHKVHHHEL